ncbi:hypothetical protein MTO96_027342 [Rhipicephalus appendiculatus]
MSHHSGDRVDDDQRPPMPRPLLLTLIGSWMGSLCMGSTLGYSSPLQAQPGAHLQGRAARVRRQHERLVRPRRLWAEEGRVILPRIKRRQRHNIPLLL